MVSFREPDCDVGGTSCAAWDRWFDACIEADPDSVEEDRQPMLLENHEFDPALCARSERCSLHAAACGNRIEGEKK